MSVPIGEESIYFIICGLKRIWSLIWPLVWVGYALILTTSIQKMILLPITVAVFNTFCPKTSPSELISAAYTLLTIPTTTWPLLLASLFFWAVNKKPAPRPNLKLGRLSRQRLSKKGRRLRLRLWPPGLPISASCSILTRATSIRFMITILNRWLII